MTDDFSKSTAAGSLRPSSREHDSIELIDNEMVRNFSKLNPEQKRKHLEKLHAIMSTAPDGTASSNRQKFNKEEVKEALMDLGFESAALDQISEMFHRFVDERVDEDPLRRGIAELLEDPLNPFNPSVMNHVDVTENLAAKISDLEEKISQQETENELLALAIISDLEEQQQQTTSEERSRKRSTVNEEMCESHPEDDDCLYNPNNQVGSRRMEQYLKLLWRNKLKQQTIKTVLRCVREAAANKRRYSKPDKKIRSRKSPIIINPTVQDTTKSSKNDDDFVGKLGKIKKNEEEIEMFLRMFEG
jgi:hypothetical protein